MKRLIILLSITALLFSFVKASSLSEIVNALKQGNAADVSKYFSDFVDIKLPQKDEVKNISKNQATQTLKDFYSDKNINSFDLTSQRELGGTGYLTGKIKSDNSSYNITLMIKTKGNTSAIVSVRIN